MKVLLDMLPFSDGLLSNAKDQIIFDCRSDALHFIVHYYREVEYWGLFDYTDGKINYNTCFGCSKNHWILK